MFFLFANTQCGNSSTKKGKELSTEISGLGLVDVPVSFSQSQGLGLTYENYPSRGLFLADAASFVMKLEGCKSGFTSTITSSSFKVYKGDRNCLVKLESFQFVGKTYTPSKELAFTSWLTSDTAKFVNIENSEDIFFVTVNSQLTQESATEQDTISYSFYQAKSGEGYQASIGQSNQASVTGYAAPNYTFSTEGDPAETGVLAPVLFNGINENGGGLFIFNMYCKSKILDTECPNNDSSMEGAVPYADIQYKLIDDTYDVKSGATISISDLDDIMSSDVHDIDVDNHQIVDNNRGFKTVVMDGPDRIHENPDMIFILKNGLSYTYFSVSIALVDNSFDVAEEEKGCEQDEECHIEEIEKLCSTLEIKSEKYKVKLDELTESCAWGENGNMEATNNKIAARATTSIAVGLPDNAVICELEKVKSKKKVEIDDHIIFTWNDKVLMGTMKYLDSHLEKVGSFYQYVWDKMKGMEKDKDEFCFDNDSCSKFPEDGDDEHIQLEVSEEWSRKLSASLRMSNSNIQHEISVMAFGDNNSSDCEFKQHSGNDDYVEMEIKVDYVIEE